MVSEAEIIIDKCIGVKTGEKCTVVTDSTRRVEGEVIAAVARARGAEALLVDISPYVTAVHAGRYVEPPEHFKELIKASNVTIIVTSQQFSQRFSHKIHYFLNQSESCSVYQIDEGLGSWDLTMDDIEKIMDNCHKIMDRMKDAKLVRVTSNNGTDIRLCIDGRQCLPVMPIMKRAAIQAAMPIPLWGELNWAPVEELTEGRAVIDGILMRWGAELAVSEPVEWIVRKGRIVDVKGGNDAREFIKTLESADENAYVIGELGIGASHKARLGTMEEKGRLGTVHLGVGSNKGVYPGGRIISKIHGDGTIRNVTVYVDSVKIIEEEKIIT
jgi:leucyl aminopeptidase (aminopeptidase T)